MKNYDRIDSYITELYADVYPQPPDAGHSALAQKVIDRWMSRLPECKSVLDLGCGVGFCQPMFEAWGKAYEGICLGEDFIGAQRLGRNVKLMDFNFLEYDDNSFDLCFARHSLEHSFSPLISLMEWRRVSKTWLGLVLPAPEHYLPGGRNHPYVLYKNQWVALFEIAGWNVIWDDDERGEDGVVWEYQFLLEKCPRPQYG